MGNLHTTTGGQHGNDGTPLYPYDICHINLGLLDLDHFGGSNVHWKRREMCWIQIRYDMVREHSVCHVQQRKMVRHQVYTDGKKKDLNKTYGYGCAPCKAKETCENKHDKFRYCHARQHCGRISRSRGDCEKTCCMENGKEKCAYGPSGKGRVKCVDYRKGYYWYNPTQCIGNSLKGFWCATRTRWGTLIEKGEDCKDCE